MGRSRESLLLLGALTALTLFHVLYLTIDPSLDLAGDEAQYWTWSRRLDFGYYSKPPLVAWLIRASTELLGSTNLGVRLPALLFAAATAFTLYRLAQVLYGDNRLALRSALLVGTMPLFLAGSMLMTIDAPLVFLWTLATLFAARGQWKSVGVTIGIGLLAKLTMGLWLLGALAHPPSRKRMGTILLMAVPFVIPLLLWNAHHDWVLFAHVASNTVGASGFSLFEFAGSQIALVGPLLAVMAIASARGARAWRASSVETPEPFLLAMSIPYLALVVAFSLIANVEGNWAAPAYLPLVVLAAAEASRLRVWVRAAVGYGVLAFVAMHFSPVFYGLLGDLNPRRVDPTCRLRGWRELGDAVSRQRGDAMVLSDSHLVAAQLAFYVERQPDTFSAASYVNPPLRSSQYDLWPDRALDLPTVRGRNALYVGSLHDEIRNAFDRIEPLPPVIIRAGGREIARHQLWRGHGFRGMTRNRSLRY